MLRTNLVTESNNGTSCSCSKLLKGLARTYPILQCVACCPGYLNLEIAVEYRIYSINRPGRLLNFWILRMGAYSNKYGITRINNFNYVSRQPVLTNQKHVVELLHTIDLKRR